MRRCEKMWEDVIRCEKMWEDVRRCEDEKMWRWEDVKMRRCEDEKMRRWEDVKMRRCEDEKMWRWEDVKMRRCEDEKMFYRPPLLEEPCAQTLSGKTSVHSTLELQVQPIPHMFRLTSSLSTTLMPVDHFHHKNRLEPTQQSSASPFFHYCCKFPLFALRTEKIAPASHHPRPSKPVGAYLGSVQAGHSIA